MHQEIKANYLASPPLVVAFALAGSIHINIQKEPIGKGKDGQEVFLKDIWPSSQEIDSNYLSLLYHQICSYQDIRKYIKVIKIGLQLRRSQMIHINGMM